MALIHSFEKSGNFLFRNRGQLPVILFILAIPAVYLVRNFDLSDTCQRTLTIFSISLSLIGFLIRAYTIGTTPKGTSGRNTKDGQVAESLNTSGIYSVVRHPLYLGNFFMWIGIVVFTYNYYFAALVILLFWLYYERIMFAEERFLERKFGQEYLDWSLTVPAFLPAFGKFRKSIIPFSLRSVLRREYSGVLATVAGFWFVDYLRSFFEDNPIDLWRPSTWVLAATLIITLILRSLKHYTKLLDEEGRS